MLALYRRFERVIRYIVVGVGVTAVYTAVTAGLIGFAFDRVLSAAIGSLVTIPLSFFVHRRITYADAGADGSQFGRFVITALSSLAINVGLMAASEMLGWSHWIALATGWFLVPIANYTINALWVFRTKTFLRLPER
jgi:putative flippase GtrA